MSERVMYCMKRNKNGASGDKQTKNMQNMLGQNMLGLCNELCRWRLGKFVDQFFIIIIIIRMVYRHANSRKKNLPSISDDRQWQTAVRDVSIN